MDPSVDGVDMISSMPHEILHHILSFIPTQYAIRTSVLSKAWRHLCIYYPSKVAGCTVSRKSLRKLTLRDCNLCDESIENILSGSPILETLKLKYCEGPQRLDLSKPRSLRRLVIFLGTGPTEIVAPHLHYLSLSTFNETPCTLVDVSSLPKARIHIVVDNYGPPLKLDFLQTMVLKLLAELQNVKRLTFTGTVLQILSLAELRGVPFPTFTVQTLTVATGFTRSVIPGLARLLQNSPRLEKLTAQATCVVGISDRDLVSYMESEGLNPDRCGRSKYEAFPTLYDFVSVISCKDATWRLVASFMEMVMRNVKTLETLVVGLECINPKGSDAIWFEELLQMLQLLSNKNNVSIVLKR